MRGLGCPVHFTLTPGQAGDAPQAATLMEGQAAEVVIADAAYDADNIRATIAAKGDLSTLAPGIPGWRVGGGVDRLLTDR